MPQWQYGAAQRLAGIEFGDGTFWDADAMEARFEPAPGTHGDDEIFGSDGDDLIDALAGDDYVETGAGNDIVRGGPGADDLEAWGEGNNLLDAGPGDDYLYEEGRTLVIGGAGDDWIDHYGDGGVIAFNPGDGNDTVYAAGAMTLSIGGGVQPDDLSLAQDGTDLLLDVAGAGSIRLTRQWEADPSAWPEITLQLFGSVHLYDFTAVIGAPGPLGDALEANRISDSDTDGIGGAIAWQYATTGSTGALADEPLRSVLAADGFGVAPQPIALAQPNRPPRLAAPVADQSALEDELFVFALPAATFFDPDLGDTLAYGAEVPPWLQFDAASATFSGTPGNDDVGTVEIVVSATDGDGESATDAFALEVLNVNDAPYLVAPLAAQRGRRGRRLCFRSRARSPTSMRATRSPTRRRFADGGALPAWLFVRPGERELQRCAGIRRRRSIHAARRRHRLGGRERGGRFHARHPRERAAGRSGRRRASWPPSRQGPRRDDHDDPHDHEHERRTDRGHERHLFDSLSRAPGQAAAVRLQLARARARAPQTAGSALAGGDPAQLGARRARRREAGQRRRRPRSRRRQLERPAAPRSRRRARLRLRRLDRRRARAGGFTPFEGLREGFRRL